jgi:hypothetical protein
MGWLNYAGLFQSRSKTTFAKLLMSREDEIPKNAPGFELFLAAFPPPTGIDHRDVTAIADRTLRINSSSEVGTTVAYIAAGKRTATVARFDQVREWERATAFESLGLVLGTLGAVPALPLELHDYRQSKKRA